MLETTFLERAKPVTAIASLKYTGGFHFSVPGLDLSRLQTFAV